MLMNLIENAVRHSPDGGALRIDVERLSHRFRIAVRGFGAGHRRC